ncbi:MAG: translation initiation factor IF-2 subunit gamma [Nanoarchaeota archaeon]|nr:translation initiation factor IF-2 subunit gamma [Nanoarchaeota archaeon]|tara:strand:+ start:1386 stop:2621 length:1236 start_codon:yes stop_codon:yes gene_type:complete
MVDKLIPEINIGLFGHVDSGKTTLVSKLSGKWTDVHSEEIKRGITIKLGYAEAVFYKCSKCKDTESYNINKKCSTCNEKTDSIRKVSFIDAPGHETLMATMLSGAAIIDAALLLISANETCPQPQTREHLMALEILGVKNIIIIQNKIDLADKKTIVENYKQIKKFTKGTIAESSPIIPISAQHDVNINALVEEIEKNFPTPKRDLTTPPLLFIARSFDVNKPGAKWDKLVGGVLGGALKQGKISLNDEITIAPGLKLEEAGKTFWKPLTTRVTGLKHGNIEVKEIIPGGSVGVMTQLDPSLVKSDNLIGNIAGHKDKLPKTWHEFYLKPTLLKRVVGSKEDLEVESIKKGENLMLNVNSSITLGIVDELKKDLVHISLRIPVCVDKEDRFAISRRIGMRWRLIGIGTIIE